MQDSQSQPEIKHYELFPITLASFTYDGARQINTHIRHIISSSKNYKTNNKISENLEHYYNTSNENLLLKYSNYFLRFNKFLKASCLYYINEILGYKTQDVAITSSWINVANKGASQVIHHHSNSFVSGTYYVNFEEEHAPIAFENPRNSDYVTHSIINQKISKPTSYNAKNFFIQPKMGELILWPSWMNHGYFDNQIENRISISFNVVPNPIDNGSYSLKIEI